PSPPAPTPPPPPPPLSPSPDPIRPANSRRPASSQRVDIAPVSFLCSFITQEYSVSSHHNQRPPIARANVSSAASPSTDNRCASGSSPRSVHACGSVIDP